MSFKIKKWALWRTVNLADYIPGLKNYITPGQGGINTKSYAYPWQDRILCLCYTADDVPVYVLYDPVTDSAEGPFEGDGQAWSFHSYFYGDSCYYGYWGKDYFMGTPGGAMGYGNPHWRTWDASYNFWSCDWETCRSTAGTGVSSIRPHKWGLPAVRRRSWPSAPWVAGANRTMPRGASLRGRRLRGLKTQGRGDPGFYIPFYDGSNFTLRQLGAYYQGVIMKVINGGNHATSLLWSFIPLSSNYEDYLVAGAWGTGFLTSDPMGMTFGPGNGRGHHQSATL